MIQKYSCGPLVVHQKYNLILKQSQLTDQEIIVSKDKTQKCRTPDPEKQD